MLSAINLLRNIGQFDNVSPGAGLPLSKISLLYAENGRGKTTLASILRSLSLGDANFIIERHRLGAQHNPHLVLTVNGQQYSFQNNAWSARLSDIAIFDDTFVSDNICSGIEVETSHRQKLHELILGAQGGSLNANLQAKVAQVEEHNRRLREKESAIPVSIRGDLSIDAFCALPLSANIEELIQQAERNLEAARSADTIRSRPIFTAIALPEFNVNEINTLLQRDLPGLQADAVAKVQSHLSKLGRGSEAWVSEGMQRISSVSEGTEEICPFCTQSLNGSAIISHYQNYFSAEYAGLKQAITEMGQNIAATHEQEIPAAFERSVRIATENVMFWNRFVAITPLNIDTAAIALSWRAAREAVLAVLRQKLASPLESMSLSEATTEVISTYHQQREQIGRVSALLLELNSELALIKERIETANIPVLTNDLNRLRAAQRRHSQEINLLCQAYLDEKEAKRLTEAGRETARQALDQYRANIFIQYEAAINAYLTRFNANFRLSSVASVNNRGGSSCTYNMLINNVPVSVTSEAGPSFKNTLSAGDRNTLALAFFFASLDQDAGLADKIVIVDDPMTSLDDHRSLATIHQINALAQRVKQVIIMSHSKPFLCQLWDVADRTQRTALRINRSGQSSIISSWDVRLDLITEHDKRHALVKEYIDAADPTKEREVATALRYILETYLRVAYPVEFPPGLVLGNFHTKCERSLSTPNQLLNTNDTTELRRLMDYSNKFHHDTNPAYATELINDQELLDYCRRVIRFTQKS